MTQRPFATIVSTLLTVLLVTPSVFFIAPQKTYAIFTITPEAFEINPVVVGGITTIAAGTPPVVKATGISAIKNAIMAALEKIGVTQETITAVKTTASLISDIANEAALKLLVVDRYVIQPLAFILSGNLLKAMTSSVISFVIGKSNGIGAPQFVQNVNGLLQSVGDVQASVFFKGLSQLNSPFGSSIASALRINYLQQTSAAGFFAANKSTLLQSSPNINAFLNDDWSQGGVRTWFALTTQTQNNPYTLYQASRAQLSTLVGTAQTASTKQLDWGKGFLSWCGASKSLGSLATAAGVGDLLPNCTKANGSPGSVLTPGSVIADVLSQNMDSERQKLVAAGNAGKEINAILGNVGAALKSVNSAVKLLGGFGVSFGLAGAAQSSGGGRSILGDLNTPGFAGATTGNVFQNAAALPSSGSDVSSRITRYQAAWNTITTAANTASTTAASLAHSCPAQAGGFTAKIKSLLTQAAAASTTIANATATVARVQSSLQSATDATVGTYDAELQALQNMPPTGSDVATAESDAQSTGAVAQIADTPELLDTSRLSLVDQMEFISTNAQAIQLSCFQTRLAQYKAAWDTITTATNNAKASVAALASACPAQAVAVAGFTEKIQSVQMQIASSTQTIATATAAGTQPTDADVASAQADAKSSGVTGSSLVDQMNTVGTNAQLLKEACTAPAPGSSSGNAPPPTDTAGGA